MAKPRHLDEFERIARFFAPLAGRGSLNLKDDVALIDGPGGTDYELSTDAIVEGVHFFSTDPPRQIAQKLLRVNLSDLAAKGAKPVGYLLTAALTQAADETWLRGFSSGLALDQKRFGIVLLGGDTVRSKGAAILSLAAVGKVAAGTALLRGTARAGDRLFMSGTLGDAALGLRILKGGLHKTPMRHRAYLVSRYRLPQPRLELGRKLVGIASAAMDVSDGLVADLRHLCAASGVGAIVETGRLPLSNAARAALVQDRTLLETILGGGDDYEILFTAAPSARRRLAPLGVSQIGRITAGRNVTLLDGDGRPIAVTHGGYRHF
jgi:thiamine-monophosphate kinase